MMFPAGVCQSGDVPSSGPSGPGESGRSNVPGPQAARPAASRHCWCYFLPLVDSQVWPDPGLLASSIIHSVSGLDLRSSERRRSLMKTSAAR